MEWSAPQTCQRATTTTSGFPVGTTSQGRTLGSCRTQHKPRCQPTRSAITVAGIHGVAVSNSRIAGSNASTAEPAARSYFGGRVETNAAATVFREIPNCFANARADPLRAMQPPDLKPSPPQ